MTEYIPTDTDISEIGDYQDDYNSLLAKSSMLSTENEILRKQLKDEIFERDNRIQHLIFENERVKSSLESANNLLTFFQSQDNSKYKKINEQLSTKNFDLEQTNHFLKRENFSVKSELDEMKIEHEKLKALKAPPQNFDYSVYSTYQGSRGLETEGNFDLYNNVNTETLNSNNLGSMLLPQEARGSPMRGNSARFSKQMNSQQGKAAEDFNAASALINASDQQNRQVNRSGNIVNKGNLNCNSNEDEKYMVDEKLTENDFCVPNSENDANNANLTNDNNINNLCNRNVYKSNLINEENDDCNNNKNNNNNNINNNLDDSCDSTKEEILNMTSEELKSYIKKVKRGSKDFYKKALDMLTESEFEIIKLKSENEVLKESSPLSLNTELKEQRNSISYSQSQNKTFPKRKPSIIEPANESSIDIHSLLEELENVKRQSFEKQRELETEKFALQHKISQLEINHKLIISDYENELSKLKYEIVNLEIEKKILEKDISKENHQRSHMEENLEHYDEIIRNLEEQKYKTEDNSRHLVENLMSEKKKMEKIVLENTETIHKLESDFKSLKESEAKTIKDLTDNFRKEKQSLERELIELRGNSGVLTKERELFKKELEAAKASYKNAKIQLSDVTLENAKLKEAKNDEVKRLTLRMDDNIEELNAKFHHEKLSLHDKIKELLGVIEEKGISYSQERESLTLQSIDGNKRYSDSSSSNKAASVKESESFQAAAVNSFGNNERKDSSSALISNFNFEALNKEIENMKSKNFKLQVEINTLNNKLKVKENKIANTIRLKTEIDALKKEKTKYKADMLELKKLYEEQINELLEKLNSSNTQNAINNTNTNTSGNGKSNNDNNNINSTHDGKEHANSSNINNTNNFNINNETIEELNETILKLNYEKRFLQDQVNILTKEHENMEKLKNDYIRKLKEDLEQTEDIAAQAKLSVAQMSFKMQAIQAGTPLLQAESLTNPNSPDRSRISAQYSSYSNNNSSAKKSQSDFSLANNLMNCGKNGINTSSVSKISASDYGTNIVVSSDDNKKKSFFDKLFSK